MFFTAVVLIPSLGAQVSQQWVGIYNHLTNQDIAQGLTVDNSGNVYTFGWVNNTPTSGTDYGLVKYNSSGVQQWFRMYTGLFNLLDYGDDIDIDNSGNIYVTGRTDAILGNGNCITIKYNPSGDSLWVRRYEYGYCQRLLVDNSGNVYVVGRKGDATVSDYLIIKYNTTGTELWSRTYTSAGGYPDEANAVAVDSSGNVYITGTISVTPQNAIVTIKYNSSGVQQWLATYQCAEQGGDKANDIAVDNAGNVYITGYSDTINAIGRTFLTLKYNTNGVQQWVTRYYGGWPPTTSVESRSMALYQNNSIYITGYAVFASTNYDYVTIKYNTSGVQQWVSTYNSGANDTPRKIALDDSGSAYVTGAASNQSFANEDAVTVKYNPAGQQQWVARYNGAANSVDESRDIIVKNGLVYIAGRSTTGANYDDYLTIKYSQTVGIQQISGEVPKEFSLEQNYPNPFNPETNIIFSISKAGLTRLIVYDMLGREVETLVNGYLTSGVYKADFDAAKISSGVYFYRLYSGNYTDIKKMIVLK